MKTRSFYTQLYETLSRDKAMIFLAGARQSGKTTFAKGLLVDRPSSDYKNWDVLTNRKTILETPYFFETINRTQGVKPLLVLDEIHKYRQWKNYLKGAYDQYHQDFQFLVLGSGRLDIFQKGGDSLAGRYFLLHFFPLTVAELAGQKTTFEDFRNNMLAVTEDRKDLDSLWEQLDTLSGFPEPFFKGSRTHYRRWTNTYAQQLIREDIRNATLVRDIDTVESLYSLLPSRVGSPLSTANLSSDLGVSFNAVKEWLEIFERFYMIFRISPWTQKISRALAKEQKMYLFNFAQIDDEAARFENAVALELWRAIAHWNDLGLGSFSLHYIRNKEQQEIDFLIAYNRKPFLLVEAKLSDTQPPPHLFKFQSLLRVPAVQLVRTPRTSQVRHNQDQRILVRTASQWLAQLP